MMAKIQNNIGLVQVLEGCKSAADDVIDLQEKTITKAKIAAQSGEAKGQLAETQAQLADDEKLLAEIEATAFRIF